MRKNVLIIFYQNFEPGKVNPRLASAVGEEKAIAVYHYLVNATREITDDLPVERVVFYSDRIERDDTWDSATYKKELQVGDDPGTRMRNAFAWAFNSGYSNACIISTDCYGLTGEIVMKAIEFLDEGDAIIGPAKDGGYYLLGLTRIYPDLFANKNWGTYTVLDDTLQDFDRLELQYGKLPVLVKINEKSDLPSPLR